MAVKWYEINCLGGGAVIIANPDFVKTGSSCVINNYMVSQDEFNRVLAEWEADREATEPDREEPQWTPKVGDWVRVKESGRTEAVGHVAQIQALTPSCGARLNIFPDQTFYTGWLEPAEPQPIDKLGWWLVDGDTLLVNAQTGDGGFIGASGVYAYCEMNSEGIFLAEITDEELVAYHRERIVPPCPVKVRS